MCIWGAGGSDGEGDQNYLVIFTNCVCCINYFCVTVTKAAIDFHFRTIGIGDRSAIHQFSQLLLISMISGSIIKITKQNRVWLIF